MFEPPDQRFEHRDAVALESEVLDPGRQGRALWFTRFDVRGVELGS